MVTVAAWAIPIATIGVTTAVAAAATNQRLRMEGPDIGPGSHRRVSTVNNQ